MHLFINSVAASAGGGLTYIRNVLPHLAAKPHVRVTVALNAGLKKEFRYLNNVDFLEMDVPVARRFWYEQSVLPGMIRSCRAEVLLSTGNFALLRSPVPQVLLSRNSIYLCRDFYRDLLARREYRAWLDTRVRAILAKRSIHRADATVAPSAAFAAELARWAGKQVLAIHHGFDHETFIQSQTPLPADIDEKLRTAGEALKILFVSHYNYYRNFETLIRALPLLRDRLSNRSVKLLLTCHLKSGENPGAYRPEAAATLAKKLGVSDMIAELGAIPYQQLHRLYARADVYVTPAYTETFAHPLVEAMASGVPVVASDLSVHREICAEAAVYFPRFSPEGLAETVARVALSPETARRMRAAGIERSHHFSWKTHVERVLELSGQLIASSFTYGRVGETKATPKNNGANST